MLTGRNESLNWIHMTGFIDDMTRLIDDLNTRVIDDPDIYTVIDTRLAVAEC